MPDHAVTEPAVSVIIPAYRASADIAAALDSVFAQTISDFEVILINDGSPDTEELEAAIEPYRSRLRYMVQPNRGAGAARNAAIRASRGHYIAFLDADDLWAREFLRRQVWFLDQHPDCDLVYADARISGDSPLVGRRFMDDAPSSGDVTLASLIHQRCNIMLSTVVVRRAPLVAAGLFDETLHRGQDFELWLRLALYGVVMRYQRSVLAERRVRADGLSGDVITEIERALNVLNRFGQSHALQDDVRGALRIRTMALLDRLEIEQGKLCIVEGNFAAARYHLGNTYERSRRLRLALVVLQVAPRLLRGAYFVLRPSVWRTTTAESSRRRSEALRRSSARAAG